MSCGDKVRLVAQIFENHGQDFWRGPIYGNARVPDHPNRVEIFTEITLGTEDL
jgi:hypothetical protein